MVKIKHLFTIFVCFFVFNLSVSADEVNLLGTTNMVTNITNNGTNYIVRSTGNDILRFSDANNGNNPGKPYSIRELYVFNLEQSKSYTFNYHLLINYSYDTNQSWAWSLKNNYIKDKYEFAIFEDYADLTYDYSCTISNWIYGQAGESFDLQCTMTNLSTSRNSAWIGVGLIAREYNYNYILGELPQNPNGYYSFSNIKINSTTDNSSIIVDQNNTIINQNNTIIQNQDKISEEIKNINNTLTSEELPNLEELNNLVGYLPTGPLDAIINLPFSILNSLLNVLSTKCEPITIQLPFLDNSINLPCMYDYLSNMTGFTTFMDWASFITGNIILVRYLISLSSWADSVITFRENHWNDKDQWGGI